jgi:hypothetical protein
MKMDPVKTKTLLSVVKGPGSSIIPNKILLLKTCSIPSKYQRKNCLYPIQTTGEG